MHQEIHMEKKIGLSGKLQDFRAKSRKEKLSFGKEFLINNSLYIFMIAAIIIIGFSTPKFLSVPSIVNIISLSAANLPIAL